MRLSSQTVSCHYFHHVAVKDRVDMGEFSDRHPPPPQAEHVTDVAQSLLPSPADEVAIKNNFTTLVRRIVSTCFPYFESEKKSVAWNIPSHYSSEMARKSVAVRMTYIKDIILVMVPSTGYIRNNS